jgi:hypothetical protein
MARVPPLTVGTEHPQKLNSGTGEEFENRLLGPTNFFPTTTFEVPRLLRSGFRRRAPVPLLLSVTPAKSARLGGPLALKERKF